MQHNTIFGPTARYAKLFCAADDQKHSYLLIGRTENVRVLGREVRFVRHRWAGNCRQKSCQILRQFKLHQVRLCLYRYHVKFFPLILSSIRQELETKINSASGPRKKYICDDMV